MLGLAEDVPVESVVSHDARQISNMVTPSVFLLLVAGSAYLIKKRQISDKFIRYSLTGIFSTLFISLVLMMWHIIDDFADITEENNAL